MKNVKWLSLVLALVLCLFALSAQAETVEIPTVYASISEDMPSNDELFNEYALRKLYGMEDVSFFGVAARERLPELMKELYDALKPEVEKIAAGNRSATTFTFTPEQLGTMGFTVGGSFTTDEEFNAICDAFSKELDDFSLLLPALLRDCPYEMYWCDYTAESSIGGGSFGGTISGGVGTAQMTSDVTITLPVAAAYSLEGDPTKVNTTKAKAAAAAAAKAQDIVDYAEEQGLDDEAKLTYYAEQIMALVSYDHAAAEDDTFSNDSNPWQLINVFDGYTSTNVVCEGYSKAFQYLCDLSTFDDAEVYTVSGTMTGGTGAGPHMWNIVSMGGKNYLVDVTNSEEGTVGMGGELFMAKAQQGGSVADGYVVAGYDGTPVTYVYDNDQKSLWGEGVLTLAVSCPHDFVGGVCDLCGEVCEHPSFTGGVCTTCGIIGGYCGGEGDGTNLVWTLNDGTFAITGTGAMADYDIYIDRPWNASAGSVTSLTIGAGVTRIGKNAFAYFKGIESVTIPASVQSLGYRAFVDCAALKTVTFAQGSELTTIDDYAFQNCEALTEITLPAGVGRFWPYSVFDSCTALTDIHVAEGNTTYKGIDGVLYSADGTTLVCYPAGKTDSFTTPAGVTTIGLQAFSKYCRIPSIILSQGVTTIEMEAFRACGELAEVTIPASVTSIGYNAFDDHSLETVNAPCNWDGSLYTFDSTVTVKVAEHTPDENGYTDNGDGTHDAACAVCDAVAVDNEPHTFTQNAAGEWVCACDAKAVASITSGSTVTKYMDFADALAAWTDGTTLTLLDDVSYDSDINLGAGTRTFVGGKHTLTLTGDSAWISNSGTLAIASGTIVANDYVAIENSGTLTITGGKVNAPQENAFAVINRGSMTLDGGNINGFAGIDNYGTAELKSGTVTASANNALFNSGTATLSGANLITLGNTPAIVCNSGAMTISGGTLASNGTYVIRRVDGTLTITTTGCNGWKVTSPAETATIGEDITLPEGYCLFDDDGKFIPNLEAGVIGTITEHTHELLLIDNEDGKSHDLGCACGAVSNQEILHFVLEAEDKCVCGAQLVAKVGEAYYSDIAVAMDDWVNNGGTMTLLENVSYASSIDLVGGSYTFNGKEFILDMDSHWLSVYDDATLDYEGGTLDGILSISGTLNATGGTFKTPVQNSGRVTLAGAVIDTPDHYYAISNKGTLTISNGSTMQCLASAAAAELWNEGTVIIQETENPEGWRIKNNTAAAMPLACLTLPTNYYVFMDNEAVTELAAGAIGTIQQHSHSYTATADDDTDTITYACTCGIGTQTAKLIAPAETLVYNGMAYVPTVEVTGSTVEPAVVYTQNGQGVAEINNAGDYTATINWYGKEVSMSITILPADIADATATVAEETYTGFAITPTYTVSMNEELLGQNTDFTVTFPADMTNAGEKELTFTGMGNYTGTKKAIFTINKATPTVTAPKATEGLTYSGFKQQLLSDSGYTTGGTLLYSLDGQTWSEEVPVGTEVGDYTVYYKVDGGNNYESVEAQSLTASIGKADADVANVPKAKNLTYDGTEQPLVTAGSAVAGQMVYSLEENGTYTENIPNAKNAGDYTVWYYVQGGDNYHDGEKASVKVNIAPIMLEVGTTDAAYAKIYDGTTEVRDAEWKTHLTLGDVLSDDDVRLTMGVFPAYTTSKAGSYDAEIEVELSGEDAQNYKLTADKVTVTAIIEPKPLTATAAEGSRAYDATAEWVAPLELEGVIGSDDVSGWAEFQLAGINVGEYTEATLWEEPELTGADAGNYTVAPQDVTFVKAAITKAAADKWSVNVAAQEVLVGSGLNAVVVPATGTGIGSEVVQITAMALYSDAALQTPATDADISGLGEDESITLYYEATADNYEAATGPMTVKAIAHQHEWTYAADEAADTITATCGGTIGNCPYGTITFKLVIPTDVDFNSGAEEKTATWTVEPAAADSLLSCGTTYSAVSDNAKLADGKPCNAGEYEVTLNVENAATVTATLTIAPAQIGQPNVLADGVYTGEAHQPAVTIPNCIEGEDFTVTYPENMVDSGDKIITVTGMGNYTGTAEVDYHIARAPIGAAEITAEAQVYTGEALEPDFAVALDGKELKHNEDFVFEVSDNVNVGEGKIKIIGVDNYVGQAEGTFAITSAPADLTAETYLGETMTGDFTYGDVITIKGAVTVDRQNTFSLRRAPAANEVALYLEGGNEVIAGPVAADPATGEFTLTYDTRNKDIQIGQRNLALIYVSDGNKQNTEGSLTVTLNPKELTIISAGAADREYEKDNKLVTVTGVDLDGIAAIGDDVAADLTSVKGTLASDNAGDYTTLALPKLELTGSDKDYYIIAADEAVPTVVTITKAQLVSVELPTDVTLDTYLASADQVAAKLPATVAYTASNDDTVALDAAWTCADFDATPKAVNTFTWTVDASTLTNYELSSAVAATGTIKVTNTDALPVVITATDDSITFAQQPYGVAGMFAVDANAGDAHYEVVSGDAVLNGATLTVNKVGEIVIRLTTEANGAYASAEATATLTVTKADPAVTAPEGLTATYGQTLASVELPAHDEGTWAWVDEAASVGDAGVQTHEITFTPNDTTNWNTLTLDVQVTVSKYNTQVEMMVLNGETETSIFTYGETVTVKAQPQRPAVLTLRRFAAPKANQMALFLGDEQISEAVDPDENGIYTMTIPTADKALKPGDNAVTIKYVGTDNVEGAQGVVTVTLLKKKLSIVNMAAQSREYQPENQQVAVTAVELEGKLEGDDVAVGTLTAQVSSANVGSYAAATLPQTVPLAGEDADYYEAEGNVEVPVPQKVSITQATPEPTGTGADAGQPAVTPVTEDGKTLADIPLSLPEGAYNVPGTIHWVDGDDTPVEEGKEYAWVFIPDDPNYAPVNGTVVIYPAGEAPVITAPTAAQTVTVVEGETGTMTVTATEAEAYQWYIDRNDGKGYVAMDGATAATYTTSKVNTDNDGFTYYCQVSNAYGESKSPVFTLKVKAEVDVPQTGDDAQLGLWLALMVLSLGGMAAMVLNCKRREN